MTGDKGEVNRPVICVSTNLYRSGKAEDRELDSRETLCAEADSTSRGAWYAGFRDNRVLHRLPLFIHNPQRFVVGGIHQFHFDLAEFAVARLVRRMVGQGVLVSQSFADLSVDGRVLTEETWEERLAAGLFANVRIWLSACKKSIRAFDPIRESLMMRMACRMLIE